MKFERGETKQLFDGVEPAPSTHCTCYALAQLGCQIVRICLLLLFWPVVMLVTMQPCAFLSFLLLHCLLLLPLLQARSRCCL